MDILVSVIREGGWGQIVMAVLFIDKHIDNYRQPHACENDAKCWLKMAWLIAELVSLEDDPGPFITCTQFKRSSNLNFQSFLIVMLPLTSGVVRFSSEKWQL